MFTKIRMCLLKFKVKFYIFIKTTDAHAIHNYIQIGNKQNKVDKVSFFEKKDHTLFLDLIINVISRILAELKYECL